MPRVAGLGLAAIAIAGLAVLLRSREPQYDGHTLSYYLSSQTYGDLRRERDAREAIRQIGSNAVPYLVDILNARESVLETRLRGFLQHQSLIQLSFVPLAARQKQAAMACAELGPVAAPAIPALTNLLEDPFLASWAVCALAQIGSQTFPFLTNTIVHGIPVARIEAAGHLRSLQPRERSASALLQALQDSDASVRKMAASSLGFLGCQPDQVVPALMARLEDTDPSVRVIAAESLGWFKEQAAPAVPRLLELFHQEQASGRGHEVAEALKAIDSEAAANAGVQ
jgi:HEAT repeat protein